MIMSLKQSKIPVKIEPRIKLNHSRYYIHEYICIPIFDSNYFIVFSLVLHYFVINLLSSD